VVDGCYGKLAIWDKDVVLKAFDGMWTFPCLNTLSQFCKAGLVWEANIYCLRSKACCLRFALCVPAPCSYAMLLMLLVTSIQIRANTTILTLGYICPPSTAHYWQSLTFQQLQAAMNLPNGVGAAGPHPPQPIPPQGFNFVPQGAPLQTWVNANISPQPFQLRVFNHDALSRHMSKT